MFSKFEITDEKINFWQNTIKNCSNHHVAINKTNILLPVKHGSDDASRKIIGVTDAILKNINIAEISMKKIIDCRVLGENTGLRVEKRVFFTC